MVDDTPWEFFKCKKQLLGAQSEFTCTEKYRSLVTVKFGKPVIYLCNDDPRVEMTQQEENYYKENAVYCVLDDGDKFY